MRRHSPLCSGSSHRLRPEEGPWTPQFRVGSIAPWRWARWWRCSSMFFCSNRTAPRRALSGDREHLHDYRDGQTHRPVRRTAVGAALLLPAAPPVCDCSRRWVKFTHAGRTTLALMVWMAGWWLTEAVDIEATALLPIVTFPLLGIAPLTKVLPPYAADVIFLFMGGFIIELAIARWGLDRRIAFFLLPL